MGKNADKDRERRGEGKRITEGKRGGDNGGKRAQEGKITKGKERKE